MTKRQVVTIFAVIDRIRKETKASTGDSHVARGLAYEGYNGGYIDALNDVVLLLNGCVPDRRGWWNTPIGEESGR